MHRSVDILSRWTAWFSAAVAFPRGIPHIFPLFLRLLCARWPPHASTMPQEFPAGKCRRRQGRAGQGSAGLRSPHLSTQLLMPPWVGCGGRGGGSGLFMVAFGLGTLLCDCLFVEPAVTVCVATDGCRVGGWLVVIVGRLHVSPT